MAVERREVSQKVIVESVARSTKASARLESRVVPPGYVRTEAAAKFIETRKSRA